jgi:hypothetical protein
MTFLRSAAFSCVLGLSSIASATVTVKDAWVRGTVPAQKTSAAYMTITSTTDAKLVGVESRIAKRAELHTTMIMGGVNHMRAAESVELPAGKAVELKPGGHHVMLMDLAKPIVAGQRVPLVLTIEDAAGKRTRVEVSAAVRPLGQ